jgi:ribonuclease HI
MSSEYNVRQYDPENPQHNPKARDFAVYTDGSGHADGFGGAGCLVLASGLSQGVKLACARNHTSTARMEHEALLLGLEYICSTEKLYSRLTSYEVVKKPTVFWLSDREDLVLSTAGIYQRKHNLDLWHRTAWYEKVLDIHPYYAPRASTPENIQMDELAGVCRRMAKDMEAYLQGC